MFLKFPSSNGTCTGVPVYAAAANYSHSAFDTDDDASFRTVWCGQECARWKTLRASYPLCDEEGSGTKFAVDLDAKLGPRCSKGSWSYGRYIDPTPPGDCCHAPLGSGHPAFPFGTPCSEVCQFYGRAGSDDEWCQASNGANYGHCFCGPTDRVEVVP